MIDIKIKYRKGFPTEKCMNALIDIFWGNQNASSPGLSGVYKYTGTLVWQRTVINERIDEFVGFLADNGIEVSKYKLYKSPTVGSIDIKKIN